ncbi:SPOR domain-containing protein [Photobacterium lipolyticum]|uniref:DamX-related protein n=1 Tax=Photobacterium lipolyticum TaxID=266810 RepID=A0A2T3MZE1_9GAMM|nr:SPOR domain-containing protein [Photobacterium lipolyticum]PSW05344.1 DamX-related protein [Photobacterium lipolyticum]
MKKIAVLVVVTALAGCASDNETTQIISSSSEEVYTTEQITEIAQMRDAKVEKESVVLKEEVAKAPVQKVVRVDSSKELQSTKVTPPQKQAKPTQTKPDYKYSSIANHGYTIQVLALSHNQSFSTYLNKLPSNQPVWMNKKKLEGLPWYTLLFGQYETRAEAKRALNALPQDVKAYGPFIRSLDEIKASSTPKLTKLN